MTHAHHFKCTVISQNASLATFSIYVPAKQHVSGILLISQLNHGPEFQEISTVLTLQILYIIFF